MKKILLTGSAGYIGTSFKKKYGAQYRFVDFDIRQNVKNDVRDFAQVRRAVRGVDGVVHLAAISRPKVGFSDPRTCLETNIDGVKNVLEALRQVNPKAWIVFASSREVFAGLKKYPATEKSEKIPLNVYGVSKVCGEELVEIYAKNYGIRGMVIRFCGVYTGPDDILDRVIPRFILQALRGEDITIEGSGRRKRFDYVYVKDSLDGVLRAVNHVARQKKRFYDDVTLASDNPISLGDLARLIIRLSRSRSKIVHIPDRTYDTQGFTGSYAKAKKLLGWSPRVSLEEGFARAIEELQPIARRKR